MKWLWISGWAIPPAWFAKQAQIAWPDCEHIAVTPSEAVRTLATETYDALGGYSLGALWLLQHAPQVPANIPVVLLAPIFAFPAEADRGGRIPLAQLRVQRRRLRQSGPAAVADFFRRAGLDANLFPTLTAELTPSRLAELDAELGWLEDWRAAETPPAGWRGYVGDQDLLLDAAALQKLWPALHVVTGAGHAPGALLRAAASNLPGLHGRRAEIDVVRNFDRAADIYDTLATPQAALASTLARWIEPDERRGRAVEFGAGTGQFTRQMLPWSGSYLATDAAPRMVALGRGQCPGAIWKVAQADAADIASVDWVFACNALHWMAEPEAILRHWRTLLAPGGRLALTVFLTGTLGELQLLLPEAAALRWRTASEWQMLLTKAGFAIERAEAWEHTSHHPSARILLRDVHAMGLAPRRLVGMGRLRSALREYDLRFASADGVRATWRGWLARAVAI